MTPFDTALEAATNVFHSGPASANDAPKLAAYLRNELTTIAADALRLRLFYDHGADRDDVSGEAYADIAAAITRITSLCDALSGGER